MSVKQARNLSERLAKNLTFERINLAQERKVKISPTLMKKVFLTTTDIRIICNLKDYFLKETIRGNKRALNFLIFALDEKNNANEHARHQTSAALRELAQRGVEEILPALIKGASDPYSAISHNCLERIRVFVREKNPVAEKALRELTRRRD